ncbi:O-antigen ligase family protein [Microbacterium album]|uniref:O-antigen ligase-related domain-containing protein n=1 Tax=Microbacterium album TaxID=2053191 RepID=A0A917IFZ5_9MICO|nr:O-antigen ligase family protein [Microbacterium album]GGH46090.1 hypothetical protein GCM10010921_21940 [Microbacterium album]
MSGGRSGAGRARTRPARAVLPASVPPDQRTHPARPSTGRAATGRTGGRHRPAHVALALVWVAPVLLLPGLAHRWGWPTLVAAVVAVLIALWAPPAGRLPRWLLVSLAVIAGGLLVSATLSADPWGSLFGRAPRYEGLVALPVLIGGTWLGARLLGPQADSSAYRSATTAMSLAAAALGAIALLEAMGLRPIDTDLARPGSLAGNATDQGILGALFAGVLAHVIIGTWRRVGRLAWWPVCGVLGGTIALTTSASRAALVMAVLIAGSLVARIVLTARRRARAGALCAALLGAVAATVLAIPAVRARVLGTDALASKTVQDRFTIWQDALELIGARPWTGFGPSGYMDAVTAVYDEDWYRHVAAPDHVLDSPHNVLLQLAVAGGVPIALLALGLFLAVWIAGLRAVRSADGVRSDLLIGALTVLPAAGIALLTTPTSPKTLLPLAVLAGVLVAPSAASAVAPARRWVARVLVSIWLALLLSWTIADAHLLAGTRAAMSGRASDADSAFSVAASLRPWDADIPLTAARALGGALVNGMSGASDAARAWSARAAERLPASAAAQEIAGAIALERSEFDLARAHLESAAALSPTNPRIAHALGLASFAAGDLEQARAALRDAARLAPDSEETRRALVDVCTRLNDRACVADAIR